MHELAATHRHAWVSAKYVYKTSWDANMIRGCNCDDPYSGFDCNERQCPTGDDPMTKGQSNEIQYFTCSATSGTLTFYFNGAPTGTISHAASTAYVKAALEKHEDITSVNVTFHPSKGATVCQEDPTNVVRVEFLQDFGSLPKLFPYTSGLSNGANVAVSADGITALSDSDGKKYNSVSESANLLNMNHFIASKEIDSCERVCSHNFHRSKARKKIYLAAAVGCVHQLLTALPLMVSAIALNILRVQMDLGMSGFEAIVAQNQRHLSRLHVRVTACVLVMASATRRLTRVPAQR